MSTAIREAITVAAITVALQQWGAYIREVTDIISITGSTVAVAVGGVTHHRVIAIRRTTQQSAVGNCWVLLH
jgi:hypothetical protein